MYPTLPLPTFSIRDSHPPFTRTIENQVAEDSRRTGAQDVFVCQADLSTAEVERAFRSYAYLPTRNNPTDTCLVHVDT